MKVLVYHWNSYNQKTIENALSACGCSITLLTAQAGHIEEDSDFTDKVTEILKKSRYDLLFSVNFFPVLAHCLLYTSDAADER